MTATDIQKTISAVWRMESARIVGSVARMVHDVGTAEELAQDALVAAVEQWPRDGIPDNPGAWLMTTAKRRAIDHLRRHDLVDRKHAEFAHELDVHTTHDETDVDTSIDDDRLRLIVARRAKAVILQSTIVFTCTFTTGSFESQRPPADV